MNKKKIFKLLTLIFVIITFIGAGYVIFSGGDKNAGYAVIPSLFAVCFSAAYRADGKK